MAAWRFPRGVGWVVVWVVSPCLGLLFAWAGEPWWAAILSAVILGTVLNAVLPPEVTHWRRQRRERGRRE